MHKKQKQKYSDPLPLLSILLQGCGFLFKNYLSKALNRGPNLLVSHNNLLDLILFFLPKLYLNKVLTLRCLSPTYLPAYLQHCTQGLAGRGENLQCDKHWLGAHQKMGVWGSLKVQQKCIWRASKWGTSSIRKKALFLQVNLTHGSTWVLSTCAHWCKSNAFQMRSERQRFTWHLKIHWRTFTSMRCDFDLVKKRVLCKFGKIAQLTV